MNPETPTPHEAPSGNVRNGLNDHEEYPDVLGMHAAIMREKAEPKEGHEPVSLWHITFVGFVLFWGGLYLQRYSGNYEPLVYDERATLKWSSENFAAPTNAPVDPLKLGRRVYTQVCQACHQENGLGVAGQYPPLAQSEWVQAPSPARLIRIVLNGLSGPIQVENLTFDNVMPAWRDVLSDTEIAAVLTFVRQEWGNKASPVEPNEVSAIRDQTNSRGSRGLWTAWTASELKEIPDAEKVPKPPAETTRQ
jgi:mono/diheme cytochrome c family protein